MAPAQEAALVLNAARIGDLGLEAWQRPEGAQRAPLCVVVCPGNPNPQFGCSHAKSPLIAAVVEAIRDTGVPVVRFDYKGVGMSAPGGESADPKQWHLPSDFEAQQTVYDIVTLAKEHISDKVVVCGYSYGGANGLRAALADAHAYICLSLGYLVFKFFTDERAKEDVKRGLEDHSSLACKALYIVGQNDRMTPMDQVERLIKARADGGAGAVIEVVKQGVHDLRGKEDIAAGFCANFVRSLLDELDDVSAEEPPTPAEIEPAREELQPAPEVAWLDFRVTCLASEAGSVHDSFHISLPEDATVGHLRGFLGPALPAQASAMEMEGMVMRVLKDSDQLPAWVTIEEFKGVVTINMLLTRSQVSEAQALMKEALQKPGVQRKLDEFQKEAGKVDAKYRLMLSRMMNEEVYPAILDHFNLPGGVQGTQLLLNALPTQCDLPMLETWLELETLMRNKVMMMRAQEAVDGAKMSQLVGA